MFFLLEALVALFFAHGCADCLFRVCLSVLTVCFASGGFFFSKLLGGMCTQSALGASGVGKHVGALGVGKHSKVIPK